MTSRRKNWHIGDSRSGVRTPSVRGIFSPVCTDARQISLLIWMAVMWQFSLVASSSFILDLSLLERSIREEVEGDWSSKPLVTLLDFTISSAQARESHSLFLLSSLPARLVLPNMLGWGGGKQCGTDRGVNLMPELCRSSILSVNPETGWGRGEGRGEVGGIRRLIHELVVNMLTLRLWCFVFAKAAACHSASSLIPDLLGWRPSALKRCLRPQNWL